MKLSIPCLLILVLILLTVLRYSLFFMDATVQVATLPTIDRTCRRYHTSEEIFTNMALGETKNPFYQIRPFPDTPLLAFEPVTPPEDKRLRVMIVGGQHGRELVTSELCHAFIRLLQGQIREILLTRRLMELIAKNVGFYVVPINNPYSREQKGCSRTNHNGVDLNRNYPSDSTKPRDLPPKGSEDYGGMFAISEPETQALDAYLDYVQPHVLINIHSGGNAVLIPYDADPAKRAPNYNTIVRILNRIRVSNEYKFDYQMGPSSLLYYTSFGTLMDYAIDFKNVDVALTLEIYSNTSDDCFQMFNPPEGIELSRLIEKWTYFLIVFIEKLEKAIK